MDDSGSRFSSLDGVRCLAILPVVWHHSTPEPPVGLLGRGPLGVHLFFAVSGFLITTLLLRERRRNGTVAVGRFFARRALRIFPLYYAVLGLYVIRAEWFLAPSPMRTHFLGNVPWFATYTTNWLVDFSVPHPVIFGFSWSLSTEEQFYLAWPWLVRFSRSRLVPVLALAFFLGVDSAGEHGLFSVLLGKEGVLLRVVTSISAPICLGALLALAMDAPRLRSSLRVVLGGRGGAPMALASLALLVAIDGVPLLAVHLAMVAFVGAVTIRPDHGLARLLDARPLRHVGEVSYGVYLLHVAVITALKAVLPAGYRSALTLFILAILLSVLLATLSYRYLERPFLVWKERFRAPTGPRPISGSECSCGKNASGRPAAHARSAAADPLR